MKRTLSWVLVIVLLVACLPLGIMTYAAEQEVTLSSGDSLATALTNVADGGTIRVEGTVAVTAAPGTHNKTVTITGGNLDFSGLSGNVSLGDHITFENITLTFASDRSPAQAIYANGYKVKIGENVTMPNAIRLFGGKSGGSVASTNLTVLSGYYTQIFGGGNNCNITGNVNLYVGGNVNKDIDAFSHSYTNCVYGGNYTPDGSTNTIGGAINTVFTGNAKANYIYGGNLGPGSCIVTGGVNLTVSGGSMMSVYGGSQSAGLVGDVDMTISGGTMQQVFGGSQSNTQTGDVKLDITGGTIQRRVYGGCYNEVSVLGSWKTSAYVDGTITVILHSGVTIDYSYSSSGDTSFYARSRYKNANSNEITHLVYADEGAKSIKLKSFTGYMSGVSTADYTHLHTYSASGAVITQNCIDSKCSASATLVIEGNPLYTGSAVEPGNVVYNGTWYGGDLEVAYTNNVNPGTGSASISCGGATATAEFTISRDASLYMNGVGYGSLEDALEAAKKTSGTDTIALWDDVNLSSWLVIDTDVILIADKAVTISAADTQTGSMIRVIPGGKITIEGASEDAKITLAAGVNTAHVVVNNGGEINLTNVVLQGNKNTAQTKNNKSCGIFNDDGIVNAKSVDVVDMVKGDGIYALAGTTINLDNVTVANSGRYGIKVSGIVNIYNTADKDHALSVSGTTNNAIDVENGGQIISHLEDVSEDTYVIRLFDNLRKGLKVRLGGSAELTNIQGM